MDGSVQGAAARAAAGGMPGAERRGPFSDASPRKGPREPGTEGRGSPCALRGGDHLPPVEAMPSMNCRWKIMYRMTMGSIASRAPAIITG